MTQGIQRRRIAGCRPASFQELNQCHRGAAPLFPVSVSASLQLMPCQAGLAQWLAKRLPTALHSPTSGYFLSSPWNINELTPENQCSWVTALSIFLLKSAAVGMYIGRVRRARAPGRRSQNSGWAGSTPATVYLKDSCAPYANSCKRQI